MTEAELVELISHCPTLYHMAERGSWESIRERGLMSTSALLDYYNITGYRRENIERSHRPGSVYIKALGLPPAVIRDQGPMSDATLRRALPEHLEPSDWYGLLNSKVFFWLTEERLHKLTNAQLYRSREHDVLEVDSKSLIESYREKIWLCPMNSGCTKPPNKRNESTFSRIDTYPYKHRRHRKIGERVVELAVDYAVPDITNYVRRVVVKRGIEVISIVK